MQEQPLERLYLGCEVYTVETARPRAEAVAVRGDTIAAVGPIEECRAALSPGCDEVDLGGGTLLPGFIDTHIHPVMLAFYEMNAALGKARSISDVQEILNESAAAAGKGAWVLGLDFDDQKLAEKRMLTRQEIDTVSGGRPAVIVRYDGHMLLANTAAIEAAGVDASSPDPPGGFIDREPDGFPAGPFREAAAQVVLSAMPPPDIPVFMGSARGTFEKLAARGITSLGAVLQTDAEGPGGEQGALDLAAMLLLLEDIPQTIFGLLIARDIEKILDARRTPLEQPGGRGHRVGAMKIFADGSLGSHTAFMSRPFSDAPDNSGFLIYDESELYRRMVAAHNLGLQIATHAIGDAANRTIVDLYGRLLREHPRSEARHRLEHASVLDERLIDDMARLGVVAAVTPLYVRTERAWLGERLGERVRMTYPFRSMLDAGVRLAGSSDAPVESTDVLGAIQCCVTRDGFETQEGVTAAEAVRMYTLDAAYAQHQEEVRGSIAAGKRADMVLLGANPVDVPTESISGIRVLRTIAGGKTCFQAAGAGGGTR
ncbi:MAG TPA: amidohydrolase [Candidatus Anoxymicrobiaceae bacterium]